MRYHEILEDISQPTTAFQKWFGNSKVVDANGKPLVCYHGTFKDFHIFNAGSHFGDADAANMRLHIVNHSYGFRQMKFGGHGGAILPVYLRITNPLRIIDDGGLACGEDLAEAAMGAGAIDQDEYDYICEDTDYTTPQKRLFEVLTRKGFDGLVYKNTVEGNGDSWVPFAAPQIKSAFNKGTFDPEKKSISEDYDFDPGEVEGNFKHWFGASKVVDANGKPLTCFHGTFSNFDTFYPGSHFGDNDAANSRIKNSIEWKGGNAQTLNGANIMPVYLSIKTPLRIIDDGGLSDIYDLVEAVVKTGAVKETEIGEFHHRDIKSYTTLFKVLAKRGYDGLVYENIVEGNGDSWVPFWKHQIKSVYNRGTWSKLRDNISEADTPDPRMQRAKEMGFTIPAFHGTGAKFNEFSLEKGKPSMMGGHAPHFADNKKEANGYAKERRQAGEKAKVIHVLLRVNNPLVIDMNGKQGVLAPKEYQKIVGKPFAPGDYRPHPTGYDALRELGNAIGYTEDRKDHWNQVYSKLMELGYDALKYVNVAADYQNGIYTKYIVFDPKNIRSVDAEFNTSKSDSRNIFETNDSFQRWFGNSEVVDADGNPLVVYHGTPDEFDAFDSDKTMDSAFWFTSNKDAIERGEVGASGNGNIMAVYLSAKKLAGWNEYEKYTYDQLIRLGYDGVKLDDDFIVFSPSQIKSVDNSGDWDGNHPNIMR